MNLIHLTTYAKDAAVGDKIRVIELNRAEDFFGRGTSSRAPLICGGQEWIVENATSNGSVKIAEPMAYTTRHPATWYISDMSIIEIL